MNRSIFTIMLSILMIFPLGSCNRSIRKMLEPGVSLELARYRKIHISQVSYELFFRIPENTAGAITGKARIAFHMARAQHGVILDFQAPPENVGQVVVNGQEAQFQFLNGHILIPSDYVHPYKNLVEIEFTSTDQAMNRSPGFMYTLLVPDRASTAFPCFDQPDIKATYRLSLDIPAAWTALSNGPLESEEIDGGRKHVVFREDKPISTYLFAFAAGEFNTVSDMRGSREITIYHRETDQEKLEHNLPRIFGQHFDALEWLENYTGIPYPFAKFDMILLPGFQYSGMEHPGAIWYRDSRLLLDANAPISQQLGKASLIAHETAHMWFGNLVTMEWFDDVWLKEVFAGFMADKIVHPQYPEVNHELQFLLSHYPRASAVDRSRGTHPIKQQLGNMKQAGTLYGAIIYNKAPIVFQDLEVRMGEPAFRRAVQEYLQEYYLDNADWDDLAAIFDRHTPLDIMDWSEQWIYGTGMPAIPLEGMNEEYLRGAGQLELYEAFLQGMHSAENYYQSLLSSLDVEGNPQLARYMAGNLQVVYWRFFSQDQRRNHNPATESLLWEKLTTATAAEKSVFFDTYLSVALSDRAMQQLVALFDGTLEIDGLELTEDRLFGISAALMLREHDLGQRFYDEVFEKTENPDRRRRMAFLLPALSPDPSDREMFFASLRHAENRRPEPWVTEGLYFLHHPLRNQSSKGFIQESLEMLPEIQRTGDIFFPLNWLETTLGGYRDTETATRVKRFLEDNPELDENLKLKVLQAADLLFRAASTSG
jgi:aminopeptidase N